MTGTCATCLHWAGNQHLASAKCRHSLSLRQTAKDETCRRYQRDADRRTTCGAHAVTEEALRSMPAGALVRMLAEGVAKNRDAVLGRIAERGGW